MVGVLDVRKRHGWWKLMEGFRAPESNALTPEGIYDGRLTEMWKNAILNSLDIVRYQRQPDLSLTLH